MIRSMQYGLLLLIVAALIVGVGLWQRHSMAYGFEVIGPDDPIEKVVWLMGKPNSINTQTSLKAEGWVLEYNYLSPIAWLFGDGWSVRFDRNDRVMGKTLSTCVKGKGMSKSRMSPW